MESRIGIVVVGLLAAAGCSDDGSGGLFDTPGGGAGANTAGGSATGGSQQGGSAGRSGSGTGGSSGSSSSGGKAGRGGASAAGGEEAGGEDNAGSNASGGSKPTGGNAGGGGDPAARCAMLETEYRDTLEVAQECDPRIDSDQCTEQVPSDLACGCPTFVNPENAEAVARLNLIRREALLVCDVRVCPAIACVEPNGFCTGSGSGKGHCEVGLATEARRLP